MEITSIKRLNITLIYDNLSELFISRDVIKRKYGDEVAIIEAPENILIVDFDLNSKSYTIQGNYNNNNLSVNLTISEEFNNINSSNIEKYPLLELTEKFDCMKQAVKRDDAPEKIVAYGFNYEGEGKLNRSAQDTFVDLLKNPEVLNKKLNCQKISNFIPTFTVCYDEVEMKYKLTPAVDSEEFFKFQFNAHFEKENLVLPDNFDKTLKKYFEFGINDIETILA